MGTLQESIGFSDQIRKMFDSLAPRYDFLNRLLSLGVDRYWRRKAVSLLHPEKGGRFLDVATGTCDVVLEIANRVPAGTKSYGIDFSRSMLLLGQKKLCKQGVADRVKLQQGCGQNLPYADNSFDGSICAFGIRNFSEPLQGLKEMVRVLKPGGRLVILEFSYPKVSALKKIYQLYFEFVLPQMGKWVSGNGSAYSYLPDSVSRFPIRHDFVQLMERAGFGDIKFKDLSLGIVTLYLGKKHG
jgi:demethylmenaquinone methyltransferase/2-methoxy-6-polyprenyl-1,4-benzoquinol methylase